MHGRIYRLNLKVLLSSRKLAMDMLDSDVAITEEDNG